MTRWHYALLSTSLFLVAGVAFWAGAGLLALFAFLIGWGAMTGAAWSDTEGSETLPQPTLDALAKLEPTPVTFLE